MDTTFLTIEALSEGFYKEKGSKFLAFAIPCTTEDEVKNHLAALWKTHPQACHVCYAFRLGSDKKKFRASDDGEPSNSAGPPILGQIVSFDLTNILVAIVRYYGGTNLGVGGLINAYRTASKEALETATIKEDEDKGHFQLDFGYAQMPAVMNLIKARQLKVISQELGMECRIVCEIPLSDQETPNRLKDIDGVIVMEHGTEQ